MKLSKVREILDADILAGEHQLNRDVNVVFGTDLISHILAYVEEDPLLLTGLSNLQVIKTADMLDLTGVVFVRGTIPDQEVVNLAVKKELPLLTTSLSMFDSCGRLYQAGLRGVKINKL